MTDQDKAVKQLIADLNADLAGEYNAIISYIQYSSMVTGPWRPQLVEFLQSEIPDEQGHAQYLADKIVSLGGTPTVEPKPVSISTDARELIELIYRAEAETVENYRQRIDQADAVGEIGLRIQLEDMLADETRHRDECRKILEGWTD